MLYNIIIMSIIYFIYLIEFNFAEKLIGCLKNGFVLGNNVDIQKIMYEPIQLPFKNA